MGNEGQLIQLFQNLIGNGIKFHKENELPIVHIRARRMKSEWIFLVADNGIGIESQYFERIFVIFNDCISSRNMSALVLGCPFAKRLSNIMVGKAGSIQY